MTRLQIIPTWSKDQSFARTHRGYLFTLNILPFFHMAHGNLSAKDAINAIASSTIEKLPTINLASSTG